jgi:hypothetical protein
MVHLLINIVLKNIRIHLRYTLDVWCMLSIDSSTDQQYIGIRHINPAGVVRTLQLSGFYPVTSGFSFPSSTTAYTPGLVVDNQGNLFVTVTNFANPAILRVSYTSAGTGTTFVVLAGGNSPAITDGVGASASFVGPGFAHSA